ncbi:unnamed protein product, partial [Didymodactylos carnosus]
FYESNAIGRILNRFSKDQQVVDEFSPLTFSNKIQLGNNETSTMKPTSHRKFCGLDWAQSSWKRWIYVAFWWWLNPILNTGYKRGLTDDDLFDLSRNDDCGQLLKKIEIEWEKYEKKHEHVNTWKIVIKAFWKEALVVVLMSFPFAGIKVVQPLLLKEVVLNISDSSAPSYAIYLYAIGLSLATILQAFLNQQLFFRASRIGTQVRIAISSIIYKRVLSLQTSAVTKTTTGQVINLISNDASKFEDLGPYIYYLWGTPLETLIVFGFIWNNIGIPTLFGYAVLVLLVLIQLVFSKIFTTYRKNTVKWTDERIKVIHEILVSCQIVKMFSWEESWENVVCDARKNEFNSILKASRLRAINMSIFFSSLSLISLATFGGSWLMGQTLSPANIFTVLAFFSIIREPMTSFLPLAIERLSDSVIASKRIDEFMNLPKQINTKIIQNHSSDDPNGIVGNIVMDKASFTWDSANSPALIEIDLNVNTGSLVGIMGTIGSCKSSLLQAILGEMFLVQGSSKIYGTLAYVSQTAWIFAGTIRENILFGKSFDEQKYKAVLKSCCLIADLRTFQAGDLTVIGEKGINLSGGQKTRVSLARALYAEADIYLFDDPLATIDPVVARKLFKRCISNEGILNGKTRLLVTHQIQFLPKTDHCILLDCGKVKKQGTFDQLCTIDEIKQSYEQHQSHTNGIKKNSERNDSNVDDDVLDLPQTNDKNSIIKDEVSVHGTISGDVWVKLFISGYGWSGLLLLIFLMLLGEAVYDTTNVWLGLWSSKPKTEQRESYYAYTYLGLAIGTLMIALIRTDYFFQLMLRGAYILHNNMLKGVLYSSLRFYESNPVGRILNRFSKDQQVVDELLPLTFFNTIQLLLMAVGGVVIIAVTNPWVTLILIPIIPTFLWLRRFYSRTSREIKRLESVTRSPVYALISSSLSGLMTIRAYKAENDFIDSFIDKVNTNSRALFVVGCSARWFGLRLDLMACLFTLFTAVLSVALRNTMNASSVALSLTYCISLTNVFQWGVRQSTETEIYMTSAERIHEYSHLPSEPDFYEGKSKPPTNWPNKGKIKFKNYTLRYRSELEPALKGINLKINPSDKIGIIGRTGAGKSSIFHALFRLTNKSIEDGQIFIDGIDISTMGLRDLRSNLNIIPQSLFLFSNTLRYNLDPFKRYSDQQLWDVLEVVELKKMVKELKDGLDTQIAEYGSNFSAGECQLICIARAILKSSKILLIDEATANVDIKTDELIQKVLREKFMHQTVLTIAHRLNTVMSSGKIVVINDGIVAEFGTPKELLTKQSELLANMNSDKEENPYVSKIYL